MQKWESILGAPLHPSESKSDCVPTGLWIPTCPHQQAGPQASSPFSHNQFSWLVLRIEFRPSCFKTLTYVPRIQNKLLNTWKAVPPHSHGQKWLFQAITASVTYPIHKGSENKLHKARTFWLKTSHMRNGPRWLTHMSTWVQRRHSIAVSATWILWKHHKHPHREDLLPTQWTIQTSEHHGVIRTSHESDLRALNKFHFHV